MKPKKFKECNATFAKNQPEYLPLPALRLPGDKGEIVTCWKVGLFERVKILFTRKIWLSVWTFNRPLQPISVTSSKPFKVDKGV